MITALSLDAPGQSLTAYVDPDDPNRGPFGGTLNTTAAWSLSVSVTVAGDYRFSASRATDAFLEESAFVPNVNANAAGPLANATPGRWHGFAVELSAGGILRAMPVLDCGPGEGIGLRTAVVARNAPGQLDRRSLVYFGWGWWPNSFVEPGQADAFSFDAFLPQGVTTISCQPVMNGFSLVDFWASRR